MLRARRVPPPLRRHGWRACLSSSSSSSSSSISSASSDAPLDSLLTYGERVLRSPEPADKVALTLACHARWRTGALPLVAGDGAWHSAPPPQPARSPNPPLFAPKELPSPKDVDAPLPVVMLHALAHIELGAIDNYWDTLVRFDPAPHALPRAFYDDFLTVAWDEARHFAMVDARLRALGSYYGALPATRALLEHAANTREALAARLAVVPLVQEARGLDSGDRLVHKLRSLGDKPSADIVAQIVDEERGHVACGIKWFRHLCRHSVPAREPVAYFHELVLQHFPEGLPGPFDVEKRLAADMAPPWYQPLEAKARHYDLAAASGGETATNDEEASSVRLRAFAESKKKVILAGSVWPERTSSAAGVRSADLISVFQQHGYSVVCVSPSRLNAHTAALARDGGVHCVRADANSDAFQKLLRETDPQLVVFDRFIAEEMYGWQAQKYAPRALRVLDLQDLHFVRRARELLVTKRGARGEDTLDMAALPLDGDLDKHVVRELAAIHRSDLKLFVSDVERDALVGHFQVPHERLHRCDFFYPPLDAEALPGFAARRDIAFIGSFKHAPNVDGVEWLKRAVAPVFRGLYAGEPNAAPEIHIYGSYSQDGKKHLKLDDPQRGFRLKGFAPDVHETLRAYRLAVAPLRFGAGIKGKIADGWANGTPCVATSIGAEGMYRVNGDAGDWGGLVADDPERFARAMRELYEHEPAWRRAQHAGFAICGERYDRERNASALMARIARAQRGMDAQRRENWTGRILWSEKFRATEFMSRFIRLKNETRQAQHSQQTPDIKETEDALN